jgi:hypothetical protein
MNIYRLIILLFFVSSFASSSNDSLFSYVTGINLNLNDKYQNIKKNYKVHLLKRPHCVKILEYIDIKDTLKTRIFIFHKKEDVMILNATITGNKLKINEHYNNCIKRLAHLSGMGLTNRSPFFENDSCIFNINIEDTSINISTSRRKGNDSIYLKDILNEKL